MTHCRRCSKSIRLVATRKHRVPLDPRPSAAGTFVLERPDELAPLVARELAGDELDRARLDGIDLYAPHEATCANAGGRRRRERR